MRGGESADVSAQKDNTLKVWLGGKGEAAAGKELVQWEDESAREGAVRRLAGLPGKWESLIVWIGSWAASFWTLVRFP